MLSKSKRQHPTKQQLYGHLPPITKTIQIRRTREAIHCWRSKGKLISKLRGAFNMFPDFFVLASKIVVNTWKLSMLLLYILWDDWPIFMISGSNEQLQQQLEYTLLKPDCHSWWISKMQSGRENTLEERYATKFCFKLGKNTTETYGMFQTAFGLSCMNRASVFEWHKRFDRKTPALLKSGQRHFHQDNTLVHNFILVTDYLTKMDIKIVPQPSYSPDYRRGTRVSRVFYQ